MVAIAAISLLVGGIGIMNIVLATVLERTHEIGIRRATARAGTILSAVSDGIGTHFGGGRNAGHRVRLFSCRGPLRAREWKTIVTTSSILIAFCVSAAVGLVFGIYPAVKSVAHRSD